MLFVEEFSEDGLTKIKRKPSEEHESEKGKVNTIDLYDEN